MKKLFLLLLLPFFALAQVSTGQEQEFDTGIKNNSTQTVLNAQYLVTQGSDGTYGKILPSNLTQTTAGTFARVNFTGDVSVVNSVNYYATSTTSKGSASSVAQTVSPDDNQKLYFAQDYISILQPSLVIYPIGNYSGQFAVQVATNSVQQKFYIEVYKTNNLGVPIASGVSGASIGSLGVTLITTLESGLVSLTGSVLTNVTLTGTLTGPLTVNPNERIRYHIAAEKVGTAGGTISMQVFSGTNYNSYYDVPVPVTTNDVINKVTGLGNTTTDALTFLNTNKADLANPTFTGNVNINQNTVGSTVNGIRQVMATNDYWRIYGDDLAVDQGRMVFEVGDNGSPINPLGQDFVFRYNNSVGGTAKDILKLDYDLADFSTNLKAKNVNFIDALNIDWAALGDSITYGAGSTNGITSYVDIINGQVGFKSVVKLAVSGITVMPTIGRGELYTQVSAIPAGTDMVTVMAGVNDYSLNNHIGNIESVLAKTYATLDKSLSFVEAFRYNIETIKNNFPNAKIFIIVPTKVSSAWPGSFPLQDYIDAEIAVANFLSIPVINANTLSGLYPLSLYTVDGLHPNDTGYNLLAKLVLNKLISPDEAKQSYSKIYSQQIKATNINGESQGYTEIITDLDYGVVRSKNTNKGMLLYYEGSKPIFAQIQAGSNFVIGSTTDDGINRLQVNGTVTGSPATLSNQFVTKSQLDAVSPSGVKRYKALISQTGTSAPTVTVLENSLGTITYNYTSAGAYTANSSGLFVSGKTFLFLNPTYGTGNYTAIKYNSSNVLDIKSLNGITPTDGILSTQSLLIEVYP